MKLITIWVSPCTFSLEKVTAMLRDRGWKQLVLRRRLASILNVLCFGRCTNCPDSMTPQLHGRIVQCLSGTTFASRRIWLLARKPCAGHHNWGRIHRPLLLQENLDCLATKSGWVEPQFEKWKMNNLKNLIF